MIAAPILIYGCGLYVKAKHFEEVYGRPFTEKNFRNVNANPELAKYLPPKPAPDDLSITFLKRKHKCRPIDYFQYMKEFAALVFMRLISA